MKCFSELGINPEDFPTATELSLIASDLASKGFIKDPRSGLENAMSLWECSYQLLRHRKKERKIHNDIITMYSRGVPRWPYPRQVATTLSDFSKLINHKLNEQTFRLSLECLLFFHEFCQPWISEEVFMLRETALQLDKRKGCVKYLDFEKLVLKHNIPQELHGIYATYLFIEAQKSGTGAMQVDPLTIQPYTFNLSNLKDTQDAVNTLEENGIYNDDYNVYAVQIYHLCRFYSQVQKYLINSKKSRERQK